MSGCVEDCSHCLSLLTPAVEDNQLARAKAVARRAAALMHLGRIEEALEDIEEAVKLQPEDHILREDRNRIEMALNEAEKEGHFEKEDNKKPRCLIL